MKADVLGIIFSSTHADQLGGLTTVRTMGSVPFGGRYRLIDFPLSNFVNSNISKVAVIARSNYQSLMDHIESGKTWDLARKNGGLTLFPPFSSDTSKGHATRIESLYAILTYLERSTEKYVILCDCDLVANLDYNKLVDAHIESGADITFATIDRKESKDGCGFITQKDGKLEKFLFNPSTVTADDKFYAGLFVIERELLISLVKEANTLNKNHLYRGIIADKIGTLDMRIFEIKDTAFFISDMADYVTANHALFDRDVRDELFSKDTPIYTKIHDEMPVKYGLLSDIRNSLIADGCDIEGVVENCILFRGVKIGKGTVVKNSIIMQNTVIEADCNLDHILADKNVRISEGRVFSGSELAPFFIKKGATV